MKGSENTPTVKRFQSLVGSLLWIARTTRPDVAFAVYHASRKTHAPSLADWNAAKRIARYLKGTKNYRLQMRSDVKGDQGRVEVSSYSDADFGVDTRDRKSVSGGLVYVGGMPVVAFSWITDCTDQIRSGDHIC